MGITSSRDSSINILPYSGVVNYFGNGLIPDLADKYLALLSTKIEWRQDVIKIFGKIITTKRLVAWYADKGICYTYSGITKSASKWTNELLEIKAIVEKVTHEQYNSCLLNFYHDGDEGMGWHTDNEKELKPNGAIASLSLGAKRKFVLKHKETKEKVSVQLESGSILLMKGSTQAHWLHSLPKSKKIVAPRINLTFRQIISSN
jgi:alkylated DNA repair dioxygenase AlkB